MIAEIASDIAAVRVFLLYGIDPLKAVPLEDFRTSSALHKVRWPQIVAEVGENVHAGQPVLVIEETGKPWLSFNAREDLLHGLTVGSKVDVEWAGGRERTPAAVTELMPLGSFATWQAERAIGNHDRSTLRLRLDPQGVAAGLEPGMTVWLDR